MEGRAEGAYNKSNEALVSLHSCIPFAILIDDVVRNDNLAVVGGQTAPTVARVWLSEAPTTERGTDHGARPQEVTREEGEGARTLHTLKRSATDKEESLRQKKRRELLPSLDEEDQSTIKEEEKEEDKEQEDKEGEEEEEEDNAEEESEEENKEELCKTLTWTTL